MAELKFVINDPKTGKSYSKSHDNDLVGIKIGDKIDGNPLGLSGYEFEFTGGSDDAGFPMRKDINSPNRKFALLGSGPGVKIKRKGEKLRKTIRGNTISSNTVQVNLKIIKYGKEGIEKTLGIEPKSEEKNEGSEVKELKKEVNIEEKKKDKKE